MPLPYGLVIGILVLGIMLLLDATRRDRKEGQRLRTLKEQEEKLRGRRGSSTPRRLSVAVPLTGSDTGACSTCAAAHATACAVPSRSRTMICTAEDEEIHSRVPSVSLRTSYSLSSASLSSASISPPPSPPASLQMFDVASREGAGIAAKRLQAAWRAARWRRIFRSLVDEQRTRCSQRDAALRLQRLVRGRVAGRRFAAVVIEAKRHRAATRLQRGWANRQNRKLHLFELPSHYIGESQGVEGRKLSPPEPPEMNREVLAGLKQEPKASPSLCSPPQETPQSSTHLFPLREPKRVMIRTRTTWQRAGAVVGRDLRARRAAFTWDKTVGSNLRRLWLAVKTRHSLFSGVLFHGMGDLSRAQTIQVFINSLALQLVLVSMMYVPRIPGSPLVINPIKIAVSGTLASLLTMPMGIIFALAFRPILMMRVLLKLAWRLVSLLLCLPCVVGLKVVRWQRVRRRQRAQRRISDEVRKAPANLGNAKAVAHALKGKCHAKLVSSARRQQARMFGGEAIVLRADLNEVNASQDSLANESSSVVEPAPCAADGEEGKESQMERFVDSLVQGARGRDNGFFSTSIRNDLNLLSSAAPRIAPHTMEEQDWTDPRAAGCSDITKSHHASTKSTRTPGRRGGQRRSRRMQRVPRKLRSLVIGWTINWILLLTMLQLFILYVCEFSSSPDLEEDALIHRELVWAWSWSTMQRVIFNEPLTIVSIRGLPMLLRSQCARQMCSEATLEYVAQAVETLAGIVKEAAA